MTIKVRFSNPFGSHRIGDEVELDDDEARRFIAAGTVVPVTVADAKAAGVDEEMAASKRKKG